MAAPATPNLAYQSFSTANAQPVSLPVFSAPFPGVNADYVLTQDFQCRLKNFTRLALDTDHPDYTDFKLAEEGELRDMGGGVVQWTRTYAKLPTNYSEVRGSYAYTFPGFSGILPGVVIGWGGSAAGRNPTTLTVPLIVQRDFFRTSNPAAISLNIRFQPRYGASGVEVEFLVNNADNPLMLDTSPSRSAYDTMVSNKDLIIVEDSTIERLWGNVWVRETLKVEAR